MGKRAPLGPSPDLEKARERLPQFGTRKLEDLELEFLLASAYFDNNQSDLARAQLLKVVEMVPTFVPSRMMLARLLIEAGELSAAREQVAAIERLKPDDAALARLK